MAILPPDVKFRKFSAAGAPLAGGKLHTYAAGTSTPKDTYTDNTGVTTNTNPVTLDDNGEASVWLGTGAYKFILRDAEGNLQWTVDNIAGEGSAAISSGVFASRPAASTALTGALYFATDNSRVYRCNGTTWDDVTLTFIPFFMSGLASEKPVTLPAVQAGRVYLETDTGKFWRWDGGEWDDITASLFAPNSVYQLAKTASTTKVTGTTNEETLYTYTVAGGSLGTTGGIEFEFYVKLNNTVPNDAHYHTVKVKLGALVLTDTVAVPGGLWANAKTYILRGRILNHASASSQDASAWIISNNTAFVKDMTPSGSVDTASDADFKVTVQMTDGDGEFQLIMGTVRKF